MQKIISYKCGNEASFTKNIFRQLDRAERCPVTLNFLEGWKMWKRFDRCYYFFGHNLAGKHLSETQICRSPYYLWNRNCKTVSTVFTVPLISIKSGPFLADQVLFRSQSETHQHMYIICDIFNWLSSMIRPALPFNIAA